MKHSTRPPARHTKATRPAGEAPARALWEQTSAGLDSEDPAPLFDAYAERLHDYAATMLGDGQGAAEIVHDTLIDAIRRAPRLRDHRQLGAWLYAGVRVRLLRGHRSTVPVFDWTGQPRVQAEVPAFQVRKLLEGVLGRLDHGQRETLLLALRHGLSIADLTAVFGHSARDTARLVDTVGAQAAKALAAERLHSAGACATSAATPGRQLGDHVLSCAACLRRGHLTMDDLLAAPRIRAAPARLRGWVLHTATDPELEVYRADIAARGGALTDAGLPRQPDAPARLVRRSIRATARATTGGGTAMFASALMVSGAAGIVLLPGLQGPSWTPAVISQTPGSRHHGNVRLAADPVTGGAARSGDHAGPAPSGGAPHAGESAPSVPAPNPGLTPIDPGAPAPVATLPAPGLPAPGQPAPVVPGTPAPAAPAPNAPAPEAPAPAPRSTPSPRGLLPGLLPAPLVIPGITVTTPPRLPVRVSVGVLPPLKIQANVQVPALKIQANVVVPPLSKILSSPLPSALGVLPILHP